MNYIEKFKVETGNTVRLDKIDAVFKDKHVDQTSALGDIEIYQVLEKLPVFIPMTSV